MGFGRKSRPPASGLLSGPADGRRWALPGRVSVCLTVVACWTALADSTVCRADTILRRDGSTVEGRVIERHEDYLTVQVNSTAGIVVTVRVETKDIVSLTLSPPESAQLAEQFRQKWQAALESGQASAYGALGQWAQDNRLFDKAAQAFQQARQLAGDPDAALGLSEARNLASANDLRAARCVLKELADKFPDDAQVAAELGRFEQAAQKRVDQMIRPALDHYKRGDMRPAILLLERLQRLELDDLLAKADYAMMQQAGMPFGKVLADARLHQPCATCGVETQSGLVVCSTCKGSGRVAKTRMESVSEKDPKSGQERRRVYQVEYQAVCPTCRGFTTLLCATCHGAGCDLGSVGPVERPHVADGLRKRIDFLYDKLGPYATEPSSLHPVNLEVVLLQAARLRYYIQQYVQLNGELAGNELTTLVDRRADIDNLLRHAGGLHRNRDLEDYKQVLAKRLEWIISRDGILMPTDFEFREPADASAGASRSSAKP